MSSPAQTSPPSPAADPGFDPLVFWMKHQRTVLLLVGLFVAALLIYFISEFAKVKKLEAAAHSLAGAKDTTGLRKVATDYAGTAAGGNAQLLLADKLRQEGKPDEAVTTLRAFIDKYPDHPLISGGWTSLAASLEAQGKQDEALSAYQKVSTTYATSFSAPVALLGQARIFKAKGKADEARRLYDQLVNQYPETMFAQQARRESRELKK